MASADTHSDLRLVVLGRTGAGKSSVVCSILGLQSLQAPADPQQRSQKRRGEAAGRQVVVVSSPDWFSSSCLPEERRDLLSSLVSSSSPGPHAFLLCVPINQPADGEAKALDALESLFGPAAVSTHTLVLFTHTDELEEDESLEEYLLTWRKDLLELVERCGDRYHTLEPKKRGAEEEEEGKALEELMEKVEQAVKESDTHHLSCRLYEEAEEKLRERQAELLRLRRERSAGGEGEVTEEEMERVREEAERSVAELDVDLDAIFPCSSVSHSSPPGNLLCVLWEKLRGWMRCLPQLVRREALLGALVGMLVGGPFGGMVGASVGSVAREVGRRKTQKNK